MRGRGAIIPAVAIIVFMAWVSVSATGCGVDNCENLDIAPNAFPDGVLGLEYRLDLETKSDCDWHDDDLTDDMTFEVTGGSLPPGISINSSGEVRGTPTIVGTYTFTLRVEFDARSLSVDKGYALTIAAGAVPTG